MIGAAGVLAKVSIGAITGVPAKVMIGEVAIGVAQVSIGVGAKAGVHRFPGLLG